MTSLWRQNDVNVFQQLCHIITQQINPPSKKVNLNREILSKLWLKSLKIPWWRHYRGLGQNKTLFCTKMWNIIKKKMCWRGGKFLHPPLSPLPPPQFRIGLNYCFNKTRSVGENCRIIFCYLISILIYWVKLSLIFHLI